MCSRNVLAGFLMAPSSSGSGLSFAGILVLEQLAIPR